MATQQPIFGITLDGASNSTTEYTPINSRDVSFNATYNTIKQIIPADGTFKKMDIKLDTSVSTGTWTIGINVNGTVSSTLVGTIPSGATLSVEADQAVVTGDFVALEFTPTSTPTSFTRVDWTFVFEPDTDDQYIVLGGGNNNQTNDTSTEQNHVEGAQTWNGIAANRDQMCAVSGTVGRMTAASDTALTAAGTIDVVLRIKTKDDGATVSSSMTASLTDSVQSDTDTTNTDSVVASDRIEVRYTSSGAGTHTLYWSFILVPTTAGSIPMFCGKVNDGNTSSTEFNFFGMGLDWNGTRTIRDLEIVGDDSEIVITAHYVELRNVAGTGASYTLRLEKNTFNEASSDVTISGATDRSGNATGLSITCTNGDLINEECVPSSSPAPSARAPYYGYAFTFAGISEATTQSFAYGLLIG